MKIGILHISDIHFKTDTSNNPALIKLDKLIKIVQNNIIDYTQVFIAITGDIAFSGKAEEYNLAQTFFNKLKESLESYSNKAIVLLGVPGNHDCDFEHNQKTRDLIINGLEAQNYSDLDESIIQECCRPQSEYFKFQNNMFFKLGNLLFTSELLNIYEFSINGLRLIFNCFNTSWTSKLHDIPGVFSFPTEYTPSKLFDHPAHLKINLIHHPLNWQSQHSHREFKKYLNRHGQITLSGHEHTSDVTSTIDIVENKNIYIESAALQESDNAKSSFNYITIDLEDNLIFADLFNFISNNYVKSELLRKTPLLNDLNIYNTEFPLTQSFSNYLESLGAPFLHKRASSEIKIDDLFINPYLKTKEETSKKIDIINFKELITKDTPGKIIILGEESSGKTTLCKRIYKEFYNKGYVPVLIKGSKIVKPSFEYIFNQLIKVEFIDQYHNSASIKYDSIDKDKLLLIIDDFHACELKDVHRNTFINSINSHFKNIVLTTNSLLYINAFPGSDIELTDFNAYNILEFSYDLKYQLISKWNSLEENELYGNTLQQKNENYNQLVTYFLGKNFLPHFPFVILAALQSIDHGSSTEQGFSYYYKYLIEESLKKNIKHSDNLQFYNYFLAEYCFFLFETRMRKLEKNSFEEYFRRYIKTKQVRVSFSETLQELIRSKILRFDGDFVSVSYNYIYYYYVASYIANNIDKSDIKTLITKLIERLYVDEFSGIIVFLSQISSNSHITETLKSHADQYFTDFSPATLSTDIEQIDSLVKSIPKLLLETRELSESRQREIEKRTIAEFRERQLEEEYVSQDYDLNDEVTSISLLNTFVRAVKTFEIFGNVIKKNWGAYDGKKKQSYINSTFTLSMRVLAAYFNLMNKGSNGILDYVYYIADKREIRDRKELEKMASNFIFHLAYIASNGIIKRVSNSISHIQLKDTFDSVVRDNPSNAYKLIRMSIIMNHYGSLPTDEIKNLLTRDKEFKKYFLPQIILQNFIRQYLHLYDVPYDERNKICGIAGITIKEQRRIQGSSKEKK